jgi:hypothetical protein
MSDTINSVIQCFNQIKPLVQTLLDENYKSKHNTTNESGTQAKLVPELANTMEVDSLCDSVFISNSRNCGPRPYLSQQTSSLTFLILLTLLPPMWLSYFQYCSTHSMKMIFSVNRSKNRTKNIIRDRNLPTYLLMSKSIFGKV